MFSFQIGFISVAGAVSIAHSGGEASRIRDAVCGMWEGISDARLRQLTLPEIGIVLGSSGHCGRSPLENAGGGNPPIRWTVLLRRIPGAVAAEWVIRTHRRPWRGSS